MGAVGYTRGNGENQIWEVISQKGANFKCKIKALFHKYKLPIHISGMDALVSFNVRDLSARQSKLLLRKKCFENFLAGNLFYPSIAHSDKDTEDFFMSLDKVIYKLSSILMNKDKS